MSRVFLVSGRLNLFFFLVSSDIRHNVGILCLFLIGYETSRRSCGNCGKLRVLLRRVFQALWEPWENRLLFFHGSHSAAVSTALCSDRVKLSLTARETDCYSWHDKTVVTLA